MGLSVAGRLSLSLAQKEQLHSTLASHLRTRALGRHFIYRVRVTSTMDVLKERAKKGGPHGTVVMAELQTKGRGRRGRTWVCPRGGGLLFSVLLRDYPSETGLISLCAGLATAEAIKAVCGLWARTKWPNDVRVNGKKVAGILVEVGASPQVAVVGIGVNVSSRMDEFPPHIRRTATSLAEAGARETDRGTLLAAILNRLEYWLYVAESDPGELITRWGELDECPGQTVLVREAGRTWVGRARRLDRAGALVVQPQGGKARTVTAGEVTIVAMRAGT